MSKPETYWQRELKKASMINESIALLNKAYHDLLVTQEKVQEVCPDYFIIKDEFCQGCGDQFAVLQAKRCDNGYFSWKCQACYKKPVELDP